MSEESGGDPFAGCKNGVTQGATAYLGIELMGFGAGALDASAEIAKDSIDLGPGTEGISYFGLLGAGLTAGSGLAAEGLGGWLTYKVARCPR